MTGPVEQWLKRMIKGSPSTPKPHITPSAKKGKTTSKIPIKKGTPSTSRGDIRSRLEAVRERRKTWEKHLAESSLGKGKGKGKGKGPAREVEQLKPLPGWEDWARGKKLRRRLDYNSDKDENPCPDNPQEEKGNQKKTNPTRMGCGPSKMVGKNRHGISLAWLSVHGTRH